MMNKNHLPPDWHERQKALDITRSFIVQAPAGSGKTELLVQRILSLLATAESPEEILSITFTRKAAGEMKMRLLQALASAQHGQAPDEAHAADTWHRARAVLVRDRELDWRLLQNPSRLQLTTIDSFCAFLTRRMPWMSRFGDQPKVTDDPVDLYTRAAETLLSRLENGSAGQESIERLLAHLDNRLKLLRDLIVAMLGRRDQWLRHLVEKRNLQPRQLLESGLQLYVSSFLHHLINVIPPDMYRELRALALHAAGKLAEEQPGHVLVSLLQGSEDRGSLSQWLSMSQLVLTASGEARKSLNKNNGFPAEKSDEAAVMKARAINFLKSFRENHAAVRMMQNLRRLPASSYSQEQWLVLEALIDLLPLAVAELREVFRQQGQVDFIEIAHAAQQALGSAMAPEELLLQLDSRLRHVLVDEFQDTSYAQYDLLRCLTAGWEPNDGRTLFVVGDPMQSIYRFREAEVGLYLRVCQRGLDSLPVERIVLYTNFRSVNPLVEWVNEKFDGLFPAEEDEVRGAVGFSRASAFDRSEAETPVSVHCFVGRQDVAEAEAVIKLIRQAREEVSGGKIAVLVRSRNHLASIVDALKKAGISYQAQDVDPLTVRPVVQDLLSLIRALHHPADRVAWLALLRAPWCGLTLNDLAVLCGGDPRSTVWQLLNRPASQIEMFDRISTDGRRRLKRIMPVIDRALNNRGRVSLRRLVESTWLSLGGPACVDESDLLDVRQVLDLLGESDMDVAAEDLERKLKRLFAAPDPQAEPDLQLMTIHKAKGLEFDTVILPGLGRGVRSRERALLRWLEHPDYELLLAPIPPYASEEQEPTYQAIGHILKEKDDHETLRLLYVSVTRAKSRLHLLGHVKLNHENELVPLSGSLLAVAWPGLDEDFVSHAVNADEEPPVELMPLQLRRLPAEWSLPQLAPSPVAEVAPAQRASLGTHYRDGSIKSRRTEEGRAIGTLVHLWLERIANEGPDQWSENAVRMLSGQLEVQLGAQGIPHSRLQHCALTVETCLINALGSDRGRWLLGDHPSAHSELAVNGLIDGKLIRATIDRTFVDETGLRWVVDYKTSGPPSDGLSMDSFLLEEKERYQDQLSVYLELVRQLYPGQPARAALYLPFFDGWIVIDE